MLVLLMRCIVNHTCIEHNVVSLPKHMINILYSHGLLTPTREIEPYDLALESKIGRVNVTNAITKEQKEQLFEKVEQQLIQLFELADEIHFHTSHIYYAPFEKIFKKYPLFSNKLRRIGQQKNPPVAQRKYEEATQIYDGNNLEQCLTHIST
jgi:hypothetical protein